MCLNTADFVTFQFFKTLTMLQLFEHEATKSISKRVRYLTKRGYKSEESLFGEESSWRCLKRREFFCKERDKKRCWGLEFWEISGRKEDEKRGFLCHGITSRCVEWETGMQKDTERSQTDSSTSS